MFALPRRWYASPLPGLLNRFVHSRRLPVLLLVPLFQIRSVLLSSIVHSMPLGPDSNPKPIPGKFRQHCFLLV